MTYLDVLKHFLSGADWADYSHIAHIYMISKVPSCAFSLKLTQHFDLHVIYTIGKSD